MDEQNTNENAVSSNNNKKYIIIAIVVVAVLIIGSLFNNFIGRMTGEKLAENILENQFGGDVDINSSNGSVSVNTKDGSFSSGDSVKWPSNIPNDIPKFTSGKLVAVVSNLNGSKSWQISATDVSKNDFTSYHNSLKSNGWTDQGSSEFGVSIIQMVKDNMELMITHNSEDNAFALVVSVK